MKYLSNAFSLQMLNLELTTNIKATPITPEEAREILASEGGFVSCIGHSDTANVVGSILNLVVDCNRTNVSLKSGDTLVVAQLVGGRLPEGATALPDTFQMKFVKVTI